MQALQILSRWHAQHKMANGEHWKYCEPRVFNMKTITNKQTNTRQIKPSTNFALLESRSRVNLFNFLFIWDIFGKSFWEDIKEKSLSVELFFENFTWNKHCLLVHHPLFGKLWYLLNFKLNISESLFTKNKRGHDWFAKDLCAARSQPERHLQLILTDHIQAHSQNSITAFATFWLQQCISIWKQLIVHAYMHALCLPFSFMYMTHKWFFYLGTIQHPCIAMKRVSLSPHCWFAASQLYFTTPGNYSSQYSALLWALPQILQIW